VNHVTTSQLEQALAKLKNTGVRMTPQRHAILSYLMDAMHHPSADEIYKALSPNFPNMSVATVYNNLKVFVEAGLVRELTYGDDASRFDSDMSEHYHAICDQCGKISDFEYPPLYDVERAAAKETGFQVKGHRLEVYGLCAECAEADIPKH
jgi:Fur family peroxide stress response transcriptional regulator